MEKRFTLIYNKKKINLIELNFAIKNIPSLPFFGNYLEIHRNPLNFTILIFLRGTDVFEITRDYAFVHSRDNTNMTREV